MIQQTIIDARYDWPIDSGPATNIDRSVDIGMRRVIARHAPKLVLGLSVLFGGMAAPGALSTGVSRVYSDQRNASKFGFVRQELTQLIERPRMQNCTLLAPSRNPFANTSQVFDCQSASGAFSLSNDLLGNSVIHASRKTTFTTRYPFKFSLRRARLLLLKFRPQSTVAKAYAFHFGARIAFAIRSADDVRNAEVDAEKIGWSDGGTFRNINRAMQIELPFTEDEISLAFDAVEPFFLILAVDQRDDNASLRQRPEAYAIQALEREDSLVVGDRAMRLKNRANLFIAGKAFHGFPDGPDGHLRGEPEPLTNLPVCELMYRRLAEYLRIESAVGGERCRFVGTLHRFKQPFRLSDIGKKLYLERQFHNNRSISLHNHKDRLSADALSPYRLEADSFTREKENYEDKFAL